MQKQICHRCFKAVANIALAICSCCSELKDSKWKFKNSEETETDRETERQIQIETKRQRQTDIERQREHMWVENKILLTLL